MFNIDLLILGMALLLLVSVFSSLLSGKLGVPSLLFFLAIGMLAGSEGIGGIYFDDPVMARLIGTIALLFVLFSGGLDTNWKKLRPILKSGVALSTVAIVVSAVLVGLFCYAVLDFTLLEGLLIGTIVSSTDAAAVFSVLHSKKVLMCERIKSLIEFESASNDPMAILLTIGLIHIITRTESSTLDLLGLFAKQILLGTIFAVVLGQCIVWIIRHIHLESEGLYSVLSIGMVLLVYGFTTYIGGNGFLAIYLAALFISSREFVQKGFLVQFHEGLNWLMQVIMFLTLGLLVFPSKLLELIGPHILAALFTTFIARPLSVFTALAFSGFNVKEKLLISWAGLRGAVPIILATFLMVEGIPKSDIIFNLVFFIVLTSVLIQGVSISFVARFLKLEK